MAPTAVSATEVPAALEAADLPALAVAVPAALAAAVPAGLAAVVPADSAAHAVAAAEVAAAVLVAEEDNQHKKAFPYGNVIKLSKGSWLPQMRELDSGTCARRLREGKTS